MRQCTRINQHDGVGVAQQTLQPGQPVQTRLGRVCVDEVEVEQELALGQCLVVRGVAKVTVGERELLLHANQSVEIPIETKHRLENTTSEPISLIEVQCGAYFGEDDIVRFEDRYGRV